MVCFLPFFFDCFDCIKHSGLHAIFISNPFFAVHYHRKINRCNAHFFGHFFSLYFVNMH
uniref:Uncharacterized protein n=1 Tax=Myoviridae sp. ctDzM5 TaxID=2825058 RepID=A0A8S5V8D8_9CAUD|nr:MAG TPA: hypothetical protein [Myoviridae sp. ctDzM5]